MQCADDTLSATRTLFDFVWCGLANFFCLTAGWGHLKWDTESFWPRVDNLPWQVMYGSNLVYATPLCQPVVSAKTCPW